MKIEITIHIDKDIFLEYTNCRGQLISVKVKDNKLIQAVLKDDFHTSEKYTNLDGISPYIEKEITINGFIEQILNMYP